MCPPRYGVTVLSVVLATASIKGNAQLAVRSGVAAAPGVEIEMRDVREVSEEVKYQFRDAGMACPNPLALTDGDLDPVGGDVAAGAAGGKAPEYMKRSDLWNGHWVPEVKAEINTRLADADAPDSTTGCLTVLAVHTMPK